jgi:hypothetical protein
MHENGAKHNGKGAAESAPRADEPRRAHEPPPAQIGDLAEACVRFVERALGVKLDYEPETLPLLDHYVEQGRQAAASRPEAGVVVAQAAGAYFGEVVRRRYPSWWRAAGEDPAAWRIELSPVFLSFSPVELIAAGLHRGEEGAPDEGLEMEEADREAVAARLADLPEVPEEEFFAPSTRLEVIDIAVDAIRARRMAAGEPEVALRPEDYEG